jgi:YHS domain-containing protein
MRPRFLFCWLGMAVFVGAGWAVRADGPVDRTAAAGQGVPEKSREAALAALRKFNSLVGEWRGAGRPRRNSTVGSWFEKGTWVWEITKEKIGLRYRVKEGRQMETGFLSYDPENEAYTLDATFQDQTRRRYEGTLDENRLTLVSEADPEGRVHRIDLRVLSEKRIVVIYQSRLKTQEQFSLTAEVGCTREGTKLAEERVDGPECIVTGGKGTMSTVYKGKTYWFCCTGCRDAFAADPEGILADAAARAAKK